MYVSSWQTGACTAARRCCLNYTLPTYVHGNGQLVVELSRGKGWWSDLRHITLATVPSCVLVALYHDYLQYLEYQLY